MAEGDLKNWGYRSSPRNTRYEYVYDSNPRGVYTPPAREVGITLDFEPAAIRKHFKGTPLEEAVQNLTDNELRAVAKELLEGDSVKEMFAAWVNWLVAEAVCRQHRPPEDKEEEAVVKLNEGLRRKLVDGDK